MFHRILVIFENEKVSQGALTYAREFALRMDSEVTFLMLVEMAFWDQSLIGSKRASISCLEDRTRKMLSSFSTGFLREGIAVTTAFRVGDLAQELLKFLAERPPFQAVIWGSGEDIPYNVGLRGDHWLKKVVRSLECPLLTVSNREPGTQDKKRKEK